MEEEREVRNETDSAIENCIEWLRGEKKVSVTFSQKRMINKVLKLSKKYPGEVDIKYLPEENDGYLIAKLPLSWLNISHRELSGEQKQAAIDRLNDYRNQNK